MFVLCPHCQFLVALDPASGEPPPNCPRCEALLQASPVEVIVADAPVPPAPADMIPTAPAPTIDEVPRTAGAEQVPALSDASDDDLAAATANCTDARTDSSVAAPQPPPVPGRRAPSFVRAPAAAPHSIRRHHWRPTAAVLGLLALLLVQIVLADRAQLAADARWRGPLSTACRALGCTLPAWREPDAFTLVDRDVRPDPALAGVLRVTASFRNDARWPQPWPSLLLTLSDVDGRVVGSRLFAPRDYLGTATTQDGLASGQSASVVMAVREPTPRVVAFNFDFR